MHSSPKMSSLKILKKTQHDLHNNDTHPNAKVSRLLSLNFESSTFNP